jgi:hypothetical protein
VKNKTQISRQPPSGAPEGTIWFGGPIDRFKVTLRVYDEELDPDQISKVLGCEPTNAARRGSSKDPRYPLKGRWLLEIDSRDLDESDDVEDGVRMLLERLPSDLALWASLTSTYSVSIFCSLILVSQNRGFGISAEVSKLLSDRNLESGFDIYFDAPTDAAGA